MKVKDLLVDLQECDPEWEVILSKDAEGNHFSPLSETGQSHYIPDTTWYGDLADEDDGEGPNAIVMWPTN